MSTFVKGKLKSTRELLGKKDFAKARDAAEEVLSYEPENYNANVFLGLALLELGQLDQSEQAYLRATKAQPEQLLAWQGLVKFYEQTKRWDKYTDTLQVLMDMFAKSGDAIKCAEQLQKHIEFRRQKGSRKEIIDALCLLLPGSPYYSTLSILPEADPTVPTATTTFVTQLAVHNTLPTLEEVVELTEKEEESLLIREFDKRRTRLDSTALGPEALKKQIGLTIWGRSKLPELYSEINNHPNTSDDLRRETEGKLLRYKHRHRCALGLSGEELVLKLKMGKEVQAMIDGVVLLGIPDEFAWSLYLEGKDVDKIDGYEHDILKKYTELFPTGHLAQGIRGYFLYNGIPLHDEEDDEEGKDKAESADSDPFDLVFEVASALPDSILIHRMLCDIYVIEEDFQNAIAASEKGIQLVRRHENDVGSELIQVRKAFSISLATGLVHLFPPKHHIRAIRVLDDVLSIEPNNVPSLMGRGYVLQTAKKFEDAAARFSNVADQLPDDVEVGLVAKEEHAWCLAEKDDSELDAAIEELQFVLDQLEALDGYEKRKARLSWRLGRCYWRLGVGTREESYRYFITSLKRSPSFAPAFTALGIYYLEGASPSDPTRATKCFQKAFELDAREVDAARRLAHSFAEEREWDLVEVVARRTIEGEGGLGGGLGDVEASAIAKHKPTNVWAWKALGVVELNRKKYSQAIQAFQIALRSNENDALSWLRLGEAYMHAGRHAAALKALNKAHELQTDDWMCVYLLGEVQRQTGQFQQAIVTFTAVLEKSPDETTALLSLAETYVALGHLELSTGYLGRASTSFLHAIRTSLVLADSIPGFRRLALKTIFDALFALADFPVFADLELTLDVFRSVAALHIGNTDDRLSGIVEYPIFSESTSIEGRLALRLAVATASLRLQLFAKDEEGIGSSWFDLAVGAARIASSTHLQAVKEKAEKQAIEFARLALLAQPGNAMFWNAFGNFNFASRPMIAQHAYIKALEINSKDASVWTNLGLLYLHNEDLVLANEAFLKAQTLDPDHTLAWVGQGLVASANNHEDDANALFEHAVGLTADLPAADIEFAYRSFRNVVSHSQISLQEVLLPPFFSLDRFCRRRADDPSALHLFGLVSERLGLLDLSVEVMSRAVKHLETSYEETEDAVTERRYAIANTNLGRMLLEKGDFTTAIDTFEIAFGLLPADSGATENVALRSLCQFGSGIANFQLGKLDDALAMFESAQEIAGVNALVRGHVTVLLAKAMWAIGSEEFKDLAKEQLLDCINHDPGNLTAVVALAAMGLLTNDEALIDAALSEILSLPIDERHKRDPDRDVESLLTNHHLAEGDTERASSILQRAVHVEPSRLRARKDLASYSISQGLPKVAQALLSRLLSSPDVYTVEGAPACLRLLAIATANSTKEEMPFVDGRKVAQKAIMVAPWDAKNWLSLAYVQNSRKA